MRLRDGAGEDSIRSIWNITACLLIVKVVAREVAPSCFIVKQLKKLICKLQVLRYLEISI
jgi:hypothetical protein